MCFTAWLRTGMTGMLMRIVGDFERFGRKRVFNDFSDTFGTIHGSFSSNNRTGVLASRTSCGHIPDMTRRRKKIDLDELLTEAAPRAPADRSCEHPGCELPGEFRAPRSPSQLRDYLWFCIDHVRAYNSQWNYYADMDEDAVEADRKGTAYWNRPTWPLNGGWPLHGMRDHFGFFDEEQEETTHRKTEHPDSPYTDALAIMNLTPPVTPDAIKRRYKELVKKHHPDANGGDKQAEERLKAINQAYTTLTQSAGP